MRLPVLHSSSDGDVECLQGGGDSIDGDGRGHIGPHKLMRRRAESAMWSRTLLKSSRKIASDAHLNTRASCSQQVSEILFYPSLLGVSWGVGGGEGGPTRQKGLMPLCVDIVAVTATSVARNTMDRNMQRSMIPNRGLVLTSPIKVYP